MRATNLMEKEVHWDSNEVLIKLYLEPEAQLAKLRVTSLKLEIGLKLDRQDRILDTSFMLPVPVCAKGARLSFVRDGEQRVQTIRAKCLERPVQIPHPSLGETDRPDTELTEQLVS